jgi:hypothetical protein
MKLSTHIEIWARGGAYLSGVTSMGADYPTVRFEDFYNLLWTSGGWGKEALRNAWTRGQQGKSV